MGQKINPYSLRLGIIKPWVSRWFPRGNFKHQLEEDVLIRRIIIERIKLAGVARIEIERGMRDNFKIFVKAAKPGLVIGRGGKGVEELTKALERALTKLFSERGGAVKGGSNAQAVPPTKRPSIGLTIEELKRNEISAQYLAQCIAWDLERRLPFRRTIKKHLDQALQHKIAQGAKIKVSGRLDGNEIARRETVSRGRLPLQTLRADIDYGEATAYNSYGTVGVKTWIYKGEVFDKEINKSN